MNDLSISQFDPFKVVPPIISIVLLLASDITGRYMKDAIAQLVESHKEQMGEHKEKLTDIVSDAASRITFFSASVAAVASLISALSGTRNFELLSTLLLVLVLPLFFMVVWAFTQRLGDMVSYGRPQLGGRTGAQFLRSALIVWNLLLIVVTVIIQVRAI